jgi:signal transduction histidine kinase
MQYTHMHVRTHARTNSTPCSEIIQVHDRLDETYRDNMKIKDSLLATVSHEMRSPLHGIIASVELMNQVVLP